MLDLMKVQMILSLEQLRRWKKKKEGRGKIRVKKENQKGKMRLEKKILRLFTVKTNNRIHDEKNGVYPLSAMSMGS